MLRQLVLAFSLFVCHGVCQAQKPYTWSFEAKKIAPDTYEIHCLIEVDPPWHTYSQTTPEGGPVPTAFSFTRNPLCSLDGKVKEEGNLITRREAAFGVLVKYFEGTVDFVQRVKMKRPIRTNLSGSVEFMVCNDQQCLPPTKQNFSLSLE